MEAGQREIDAARANLFLLLQQFEALRHDDATTKDELARAAGQIRALTQELRAMSPSS